MVLLLVALPMVLLLHRLVVLLLVLLAEHLAPVALAKGPLASTRQIWQPLLPRRQISAYDVYLLVLGSFSSALVDLLMV
jgi:hypothetical protein